MQILVNFENEGTRIHRCLLNAMYWIILNLLVVWFTEMLAYLDMQTELWDCLFRWRKMIKAKFLVWFLFYGPSTHFWGNFGYGQLTLPHCSWAILLGSLPVLSAHSFASNWQLLFLNQWKRENGHRNVFMTKSPRKNVPDVGIELGAACMAIASDRATAPG